MRTPKLSEDEIVSGLQTLPAWKREGEKITRLFTFPTFLAAIAFVNAAAQIAEGNDHHPDMDIRYNKIKVSLTTHDSGGLTTLDFALARLLEMASAT
jgi:4a-hydroxytetrahydrobiopterin dehydratase